MKTVEEIVKGLEACNGRYPCDECPYRKTSKGKDCKTERNMDAIALIQQLEAQNAELLKKVEQLQAERDAAVKDIEQMVIDPYEPCFCDYCKKTNDECAQSNCMGRNAFEWRGLQQEE